MSFLNVEIRGLQRTISNLDKIQNTLEKDVQKAIAVAAIRTESRAKVLSPIDTGRLRSSIRHKIGKHQASVSVNANYAPYIEFGTGRYVSFSTIEDLELRQYAEAHASQFRGRGIREVNISPQPFLFPAFEQSRRALMIKLNNLF